MDIASIFLLLRSSGWKEKEIVAALAARELEMPIPTRSGMGSARDTFLHLLAFAALYSWAISLNLLFFTYIDFAFPDPAARPSTSFVQEILFGVRVALATLLVSFPLFLLVWSYLLREVCRSPDKATSGVRRWLGFLSLFVAAVTISGDVITVVVYLIDGDLTLRFVLKVATLLLIAGSLSTYLALTLRSEAEARP